MQSQETSDGFMTSHIFEKGFIVPNGLDVPPPAQLDAPYHLWDDALRAASGIRLRVEDASLAAEEWRQCLEKMPVLPLSPLLESISTLLCARRILAFLTQLYVHSIPDATTRIVPPSIAVPFLVVSHALDLPPVVTFADTEFYNFAVSPTQPLVPDTDTEFRILSNFSGTPDEAHFYVTGLIVELEGVSALRLMRRTIEAVHECDGSSARDAVIAPLLLKLAGQIRRMATALDAVRVGCDPSVYYDDVRLWFNGPGKHQWRFAVTGVEGTEDGEALRAALQGRWIRNVQDGYVEPADMAGASAAQSSTIQALDAFLGIAEETHETKHGRGNFLEAMRAYMPRDHREFIACLAREGAVLRDSIAADADEGTRKAYNVAVDALRHLRTVHIKIATLYIVNPRRRAALSTGKSIASPSLGTGGTAAIPFLKHIRNWTAAATL